MGSCHHGVARSQVAIGGDGLQLWRVAVNIMNKQPTRGVPSGWGFGEGQTTHSKHTTWREMLHRNSDLDGFFGTT